VKKRTKKVAILNEEMSVWQTLICWLYKKYIQGGGQIMHAAETVVGQIYLSKKGRQVKVTKKENDQVFVELVGDGSIAVVPVNYELQEVAPAAAPKTAPAAVPKTAPAAIAKTAPAEVSKTVPVVDEPKDAAGFQVGEKVMALGMKDAKWWPAKIVAFADAAGMYTVGTPKAPWQTNQIKKLV
jgi:hypothetical protein